MSVFTGYEPNNSVGNGSGNSSQRPAQTQIVPAEDLSDLFDAEMSSLLEDLFEEPLVPIPDIVDEPLVPLSDDVILLGSGPKGLATSPNRTTEAIDSPKDDGHHGSLSKHEGATNPVEI